MHEREYYNTWNGIIMVRDPEVISRNKRNLDRYSQGIISFHHMQYNIMKDNDIQYLESAKLIEWMESLGWRLRKSDERYRDKLTASHISTLEEVYEK